MIGSRRWGRGPKNGSKPRGIWGLTTCCLRSERMKTTLGRTCSATAANASLSSARERAAGMSGAAAGRAGSRPGGWGAAPARFRLSLCRGLGAGGGTGAAFGGPGLLVERGAGSRVGRGKLTQGGADPGRISGPERLASCLDGRVDVEGDFHLRHAARGWGNSGELEFADGAIVDGHLALALEHMDLHRGLVVLGGGEHL